jgi:excisionase family DNA binding protein
VTDRVETPKQLADRVSLSERQVRSLIQARQLEHVMIGCRVHIPSGAFERFLAKNKVAPCPDETKVPSCDGSQSANATTSLGLTKVAAASAQRAHQIAGELKRSSVNGSRLADGEQGRVIPMRSS